MTSNPLIDNHPETRPFREAAAAGRFLVPRCGQCGRHHWHPRPFCPFCFSSDVEWRESNGAATVYAVSVNQTTSPPLVVAYVTLDAGPTMLANIVDSDPAALHIGQRVKAVFRTADGDLPVVAFTSA